jgi:DNA ligase 1
LQPMLAQTATDLPSAVADLSGDGARVAVDWKLDGARVQVHRLGDEVRVYTRNLREVTGRSHDVEAVVRDLPVRSVVLDGELIALRDDGRPRPFQETMQRLGTRRGSSLTAGLTPFFFDVLHVDGDDLLDRPLAERADVLRRIVPERCRIPAAVVTGVEAAQALLDDALGHGHEGVMVKDLRAPYEAGRRGAAWRKVKPAHTLDLVVLAAEWGSGRRQGWLSNLHLGARDPAGGFVMLGKTFKGMTDELLEWQTRRLLQLEVYREGHVVHARPELVVEVAFDGVQASTRYPGGVALRFARVKRYRGDKSVEEADTIDTVRALHEGRRP